MKFTNQSFKFMEFTVRSFTSISKSDDFITTSSKVIENFMDTVTIDDNFYISEELFQYFYTDLIDAFDSILLEHNKLPGIHFDDFYITFSTRPKIFRSSGSGSDDTQFSFFVNPDLINDTDILCYATAKHDFIKKLIIEMVESPNAPWKSSETITLFCNQIINYIKGFYELENNDYKDLYLNIIVCNNKNLPLFLKDIRNFILDDLEGDNHEETKVNTQFPKWTTQVPEKITEKIVARENKFNSRVRIAFVCFIILLLFFLWPFSTFSFILISSVFFYIALF